MEIPFNFEGRPWRESIVRCPIPSSFSSVTTNLRSKSEVCKVAGRQAKLKPYAACCSLLKQKSRLMHFLAIRWKIMNTIIINCTLQ